MQNLAFRYAIEEDTDNEQVEFCSGRDQYISINNKNQAQAYDRINWRQIEAMAENPPSVPKSKLNGRSFQPCLHESIRSNGSMDSLVRHGWTLTRTRQASIMLSNRSSGSYRKRNS